jgi:hypothetical protein
MPSMIAERFRPTRDIDRIIAELGDTRRAFASIEL